LGWYPFGNHTETLRGTWNFVGAKVVSPIIIHGTKAPENLTKTPEEMTLPFIDELKSAAKKF
jgi:FMN-dependent NADH-azoreductase